VHKIKETNALYINLKQQQTYGRCALSKTT